jgi:bifunctional N-acetylglucosamine-1-phosphate-uridyltransferase/glucosamine-1-phosphate-acetyltransferase GlmU-like protein
MIIPAAGLGSRLSSAIPKVVYPVNGRLMVDHLFDLYASVVEQFILVLHPSFEAEVRRHCAARGVPVDYAMQQSPTGMLDAICIPAERVRRFQPRYVWITWCDQIAVQPQTITRLATLAEEDSQAALIFPTVLRTEPYIHIVRDDQGGIIDILHQREGDRLPEVGESDIGLFSLSGEAYFEGLGDFTREAAKGAITQERNFLSFIPWLHRRAKVRTFSACDAIESVGINTPSDLDRVEKHLHHG